MRLYVVVVLPKTQCAKAQIPLRIFPAGTQIMKVGDVICVADFHDLCPRLCRELVPDFVAKSA